MQNFTDVDSELQSFEDDLRYKLYHHLKYDINHEYWQELDELDDQSNSKIVEIVYTHIFKNIKERYQYTAVKPILYELQELILYTVRTVMNMPYPHRPHFYIDRLSDNVFDIYMDKTYAKLRTEMIMVHHSATVIQRNWRKAISNPEYYLCQKRLKNEVTSLLDKTSIN
jgi:hypothetical protein